MKEYDELSTEEKWQAVVHCDSKYDGVFFYGVKSTGIFCRPSCKSKVPMRSNVIFFRQPAAAMELGFRPCKRCCPDQAAFQPEEDLVKKARAIMDAVYDRQFEVGRMAKQLGVSKNHLIRLYKRHSGLTPTQYITKVRVDKAAELLRGQGGEILEIAYAVGFKSLSNFYKCFKEQTGQTPSEARAGKGTVRENVRLLL